MKIINGLLCSLLFVFCLGTYLVLTAENNIVKTELLFVFLYVDIFLAFFLLYKVSRRIIRIVKIKKKPRSNRLQKQIIGMFLGVTLVPSGCVFLFAVLFFNMGVESLFRGPVKTIVKDAGKVAEIYIKETQNALENYAYGVGAQLKEAMNSTINNQENIEEILNNETSGLGIEAIVLQIVDKKDRIILGKSPFTLSLQFEDFPETVYSLDDGEAISWESKQLVIAVETLDKNSGIYLMVSKNIDQKIIDHKHNIEKAIYEYTSLVSQRAGLKITFMMFFSCVIALLLVIVVLIGILFAHRITKPINKLIYAAENISLGNYNTPILIKKFKNEFDILISSFNIMLAKLEKQSRELVISNRQNAWRDIARKIAHEIKNPLTPIQLSAERLKKKYSNEIVNEKEVFLMCTDTIIRQVNCIGSLVKEFSDFARMPAPKFEEIDIVAIVRETVFIQSTSHKNILFHVSLNGNYACVKLVDAAQINQIMMNLLQNAINSINESSKSGNIYINLKKNGCNAVIVVEDDGPGFSKHALEHALDPYYSTRETGSGLGLAVVYKIVLEHGGHIKIANSEKFGGGSVMVGF